MAMIILTLIWSIGILIMHLVARRNCRRGRQTVASGNKAIFEIAYAMQHQLSCVGCKQLENVNPPQEPPTSDTSSTDPRGVDVEVSYESMLSFSALTDKEIHKRISVDLRGGSMSYTAYKRESTRQNRTAIQALLVWCVKELWWLTGLFLTAAVSAGSIYGAFNCVTFALFPSYILGWGLLFAVPFAFFTGSTQASRITLLVYSYLLGAITPAVATGGIVLSHHS